MFYKRPKFRRGGSTGIDSLTPRVQAKIGFPNFGLPQAPSQQQIDAFRQAEADRLARIRAQNTFAPTRSMPYRPGFSFLGSGITSPAGTTPVAPTPKTSEGGLGDFFRRSIIGRRYTGEDPDAGMMNFSTNTGFGFLKPGVRFDRDVEQTIRSAPTEEDELPLYDFDEIEGGAIDISKLVPKQKKPKPKTPEIKLDDDDTDTGERSFEDDFKTEVAKINKALGKKGGIDKGELALMLADAIGTKGTIADKAKTLSGALRKKIATDKATDRQIAMLAYKTVGDLRKAEIMAGKRTYSEKVGERLRKLNKIINDPNESSERIEEAKRLKKIELESIPGGAQKDGYLTGKDSIVAVNTREKLIRRLNKEKAKPKPNPEKISGLKKEIETINKVLRPDLRSSFADGSPKPPEMEAPTPEEVSRTPSAQVSKLGYDELRNRLPKEITDDVIQLISDSEEALRDFAYIRTQGDVDKFNVKYGVTLVLPPTT